MLGQPLMAYRGTDKYAGEWAGDLIDQIAVSKHYGHGAQA
jgi:hypothetical protein